jgi:(S)-2-hydroxyglutarate dehydrogenase
VESPPSAVADSRATAALAPTAGLIVLGAGIVGLATARAAQLADPSLDVLVIDKEPRLAAHQSGHNSGVIHAGIYYAPGSSKSELCRQGRTELLEWCERHAVAVDHCGKVIVATTPDELPGLEALEQRAGQNGIDVTRLGPAGLADHEPHAAGLAALHVPSTAIVDFRQVCAELAAGIERRGGSIVLDCPVTGIDRRPDELVVRTSKGEVRSPLVANCAGLQSDRVAALAGDPPGAAIMPFRGEYHELAPTRLYLVKALIYPVPDPRFPFLGVHLTRMIDGSVHAGPNAVLATAREGYRRRDLVRHDIAELARNPATWRLARRYWRTGGAEVARSLSKARLARALQQLVPELTADDLLCAGSGVRAQAVRSDGTLLDDFAFAGDEPGRDGARMVHVVNAPSPAATASLAIGRAVASRLTGVASPGPPRGLG